MTAPLTPEALATALASVPPRLVPVVTPRHVYYIIGKPGCGKTTLATKLAAHTETKRISPELVLNKAISDELSPNRQQLLEHLSNGGSITPEQIIKMMEENIATDEVKFKGHVVDGLPCSLNTKKSIDLELLPLDMVVLNRLVDEKEKTHVPVLIQLQISDENLVRRRAAQWLDPVTNIGYSGQQVLYSRMRRAQGWVDGQPDEVALAEAGIKTTGEAKEDAEGGEGGADGGGNKDAREKEDDDDSEDDSADADMAETNDEVKPEKTTQKPAFSIKNKTSWPILSEQILDRLVKRPEDEPEQVGEDLAKFKKYERALNEFRVKHFDMLHYIDLDATQHSDLVYEQLKKRLEARNFSLFNKPVEARLLSTPDGGMKGLSEADSIKYYSALSIEEGEPRRELGQYGTYCPVSFVLEDALVATDAAIAASYRGALYFFANESYAQQFVNNPDKFLIKPLEVPNMHVAVLGGPLSGKTTHARMLAQKYNLTYVSVDQILAKWQHSDEGKSGSSATLSKKSDAIFAKIIDKIKNGGTIPEGILTEVIKYGIKQNESRESRPHGWVLDGYPKTAEQARTLISEGIAPKYVVHFSPESSLQLAIERVSTALTDVMGKPVDASTFPAIQAFPYIEHAHQEYRQKLPGLQKTLEDNGAKFSSIFADQPLPALINQIIVEIDPFVPQATSIPAKSDSSGEVTLGVTRDMCPVTLQRSNMMVKGNTAISAKYLNYIYYFVNDEMRAEFCRQPHIFTANPKITPPRLVLIGSIGSGKSTYIDVLSKKWNIPHVQFRRLITEYAQTLDSEHQEDVLPSSNDGAVILPTILLEVMQYLFSTEPYASKGFLLEGFPTSKSDLETSIKNHFVPDAYVVLKVDSDVAAKRALPARKRELEAKRLEAEQKVKNAGADSDKKSDTGDMDSAVASGNQYSQSDDELMDELLSSIERDIAQSAEFAATIESIGSIPVIEINASKYLRSVMAVLHKKLSKYLEHRNSLLTNARSISNAQADRMIKLGTKYYSPIGKYCPVTLKKTNKLSAENYGKKPVVYKDHIYFLKDSAARREFVMNPLDYIFDSPPQPLVSSTVCIVGPSKSGKTTLAARIAEEIESVHLTIPSILNAIIDGQEVSSLYEKLKTCLESGESVPDNLVIEAVLLITSRVINSGKGWILDGFPMTIEQATALEKADFIPHAFVQMNLDKDQIDLRAANDFVAEARADMPRINVPEIISLRNNYYTENIVQIRSLFEGKYFNWVEIDAQHSKWSNKETVRNYIENGVQRRQTYLDLKSKGKAAPIWGIGLSKQHVNNNLGKFNGYCPVSFIDGNELRRSPIPGVGMAEYREVFYCMHSQQELQVFLRSPDKYVDGPPLPDNLPERLGRVSIKSLFPRRLELKGYCPVTFKEGPKGFSSIVQGSDACIVEYKDKLFAMKNEDQLEKFMRTPWNYTDLVLPKKLPPPEAPIPVAGLPIVGYLEQTVATSLTEALSVVGKFKPKYPYRGLSSSACEFLGLYLKAHNSKSKEYVRKSYSKRLDRFKQNCDLVSSLVSTLSNVQDYVPPEQRVSGVDDRIEALLKLRPE